MDKKSRDLVMAKLYLKNKDYKMAEKSFKEYLSACPDDVAALKLLAQVYEQNRRFDKAFEVYERCYLAEPDRTGVLLDICRILSQREICLEHVDLRKWLNLAIKAFPSNPIVVRFEQSLTNLPANEIVYTPKPQSDDSLVKVLDKLLVIDSKLDDIQTRLTTIENKLSTKETTVPAAPMPKEVDQVKSSPFQNSLFQVNTPPNYVRCTTPQPANNISASPAPEASVKASPKQVTPFKHSPIQEAPVKASPVQLGPAKASPVQEAQVKASPPQTNSKPANSLQSNPIQTNPAPTSLFQTSPFQASSFQANPFGASLNLSSSTNVFGSKLNLQPAPSSVSSPFNFSLQSNTKTNEDAAQFNSTNLFANSLNKFNISTSETPWSLAASGSSFSFSKPPEEEKSTEEGGEADEVVPNEELPIENTCEMQPIEIKTGEEDETILFEHRCKLYRFKDKEYKERGLGNIKVLKHKTTGKGRLIMRREAVGKVCLNCWDCTKIDRVRDTQVKWAGIDASDGEAAATLFLVKFKTLELTDSFASCVTELFSENSSQNTSTLSVKSKNGDVKNNTNSNDKPDVELIDPKLDQNLVDKARQLQLPDLFYHKLKNQEPCSGCDGCD